MGWLEGIFLVAFFAGLLFCLGTLLLGLGHAGLDHFGIHIGGGEGGHGGEAGDQAAHVSPWNLTAVTAFVAWFGGTGYLALTGWQLAAWISLLVALLGGLIGWGVVFWFSARVLARAEGAMDPADYRIDGTVATVTAALVGDRIGEIQFTRGGARRSEGARSVDGSALAPGTEVVIVRYERGIAYVQPFEAYVGEQAPEGRRGGS